MKFNDITVPVYVRYTVLALLFVATALLVWAQFPVSAGNDASITALHARIALLEDQQETTDLAIEFGYDPMIVAVTRKLAADAFRTRYCECPTWRFVRSEKELAYLLLSVIQIESGGNPRAFNPGGPAHGLTQLVMSTAQMYDKNVTAEGLFTIPKNLEISMQHFVDLLERFHGNPTLSVIAWNRGAGGVARSIALGESLENGYAYLVFTRATMRNAQ